ncbi:MAG: hypothetical protein JNK68_06585 [Betaproteobacteria bacterium]|nr:hypothetical protein [Betaproteobacteria bacterium]
MTEKPDHFLIAWWADNLDELDREIARLAALCKMRILDPGIIDRVLKKDASVCGTDNPAAFAKLRELLMMHLAIRNKSANAVGQAQTAAIEAYIIDRLRKTFPELGEGEGPPA